MVYPSPCNLEIAQRGIFCTDLNYLMLTVFVLVILHLLFKFFLMVSDSTFELCLNLLYAI